MARGSMALRCWKQNFKSLGLVSALALGLAACGTVEQAATPKVPSEPEVPELPSSLTLEPVTFADLQGWEADQHAQALPAFRRSCEKLLKLKPETPMGGKATGTLGGLAGQAMDWRSACLASTAVPDNDDWAARMFFESWFKPYLAKDNGKAEGLFTGYYEAELKGSYNKSSAYQYPLYRKPDDLVSVSLGDFADDLGGQTIWGMVKDGRLKPYPTRTEIEAGYLNGRGLELMWVDDPVDVFFLQVQGSGRVKMDDGSVVRVGFAGKNGRPYQSIGRVLIDSGELGRDTVSMQAIRKYIHKDKERGKALMNQNPSYVFFREIEGDGPIGAQGVALTEARSLAVDRRFIPLGVPLWLDTTKPKVPEGTIDGPLRRLVMAQDTGGAIKGAVRGDFFWGYGDNARARAGLMKQKGQYYLLLPKHLAK